MSISLLRSLISFSGQVKPMIMNDKADPSSMTCVYSVRVRLLKLLEPKNIHEMNEEMENAVLSILTQIVRDEPDYKNIVGRDFIPSAGSRLEELMKYFDYKASQ